MSMMNTGDILETIEMFTQDNLDVRTVTMGISLLDCIDPDPKKACEKIYNKITTKAADLVPAVEHISAEYGIPIINKRISVTPIAMLLGACPDADPVDFAKALDAAGKPYIKLVASNGLDERKIANMELYEHAHFDSYGVGENLITSASDPVFGGVYKLVAVKRPDGSYQPKMKCSDSASKAIIPGKKMPGMGGAMDLCAGAKNVIVAMEHTQKGTPKILKECTLPLTTKTCVTKIITEMGVINVTDKGLELVEINPEFTVEEVQAATEATLIISPDLKNIEE